MAWKARLADRAQLARLSAYLLAGRRYWIPPLLPLAWLAFQAVLLVTGAREEAFVAEAAQGTLIGAPLSVLGMLLGSRVIAGELDARRVEVAYTVPGGAHRVWLSKLLAGWSMLVAGEVLLASVVWAFFTAYPLSALVGALQAATFYMVLAMGLAALMKSEVAGAMTSATVLVANGVLTGFGENQLRLSPFWNPGMLRDTDPSLVFAWTLQNRVGFALLIAGLVSLAFSHAERREKMLSG
jgi:ABC-type transport system involved in multi-copper enzyme maturation permease subunit